MVKRLGASCRRIFRLPEKKYTSQNPPEPPKGSKGWLHISALVLFVSVIALASSSSSSFTTTLPAISSQFTAAAQSPVMVTIGSGLSKASLAASESANGTEGTTLSPNIQLNQPLDLGVFIQGQSKEFPSALIIKNVSEKTQLVSCQVEGDILPLLLSTQSKFTLLPNQSVYTTVYNAVYNEYSSSELPVKNSPHSLNLSVTAKASPGIYQGAITIKVNDNLEVAKIPIKVTISSN